MMSGSRRTSPAWSAFVLVGAAIGAAAGGTFFALALAVCLRGAADVGDFAALIIAATLTAILAETIRRRLGPWCAASVVSVAAAAASVSWLAGI